MITGMSQVRRSSRSIAGHVRPLPVGQIADRLKLQQPQVSKHLRVLSDAGLVEVRAVAQQRIYSLRAEPFKELDVWLERYRRTVDERFDRLDDILREKKEKGNKGHGHSE